MKLRLLLLALVTVGIGVVVHLRSAQQAREEAELWAEATDEID